MIQPISRFHLPQLQQLKLRCKMNNQTFLKPTVDVVMDTDAYTEIDDLYAIAYLLKHSERLNVKGFCAAPLTNRPVQPRHGWQWKRAMKKLSFF